MNRIFNYSLPNWISIDQSFSYLSINRKKIQIIVGIALSSFITISLFFSYFLYRKKLSVYFSFKNETRHKLYTFPDPSSNVVSTASNPNQQFIPAPSVKVQLYDHALSSVFQFLDTKELARIQTVCQQWKKIGYTLFELSSINLVNKNFQDDLEKKVRFEFRTHFRSSEERWGFSLIRLFIDKKGKAIQIISTNDYSYLGKKSSSELFSIHFLLYALKWKGPEVHPAFKHSIVHDNKPLPGHLKYVKEIFFKEMNLLAEQSWKIAKKEQLTNWFPSSWYEVFCNKRYTRQKLLEEV